VAAALAQARARLEAAGFEPEYVELRDAGSLAPVDRLERPARLLAAARLGSTRLIDNVPIIPPPPGGGGPSAAAGEDIGGAPDGDT
jgi:pantoate--beta-alanine ligase